MERGPTGEGDGQVLGVRPGGHESQDLAGGQVRACLQQAALEDFGSVHGLDVHLEIPGGLDLGQHGTGPEELPGHLRDPPQGGRGCQALRGWTTQHLDHALQALQQDPKLVASSVSFQHVEFVEDDGAHRPQVAGVTRQQRVQGLGRGQQDPGLRPLQGFGMVARPPLDTDPAAAQRDLQPAGQVVDQGPGGADHQDPGHPCAQVLQPSFHQGSHIGLGLARGGRRGQQHRVPRQDRLGSLNLNGAGVRMSGQKGIPGPRQAAPQVTHAVRCPRSSRTYSEIPSRQRRE